MITEDNIKSMKSKSKRDLLAQARDEITETFDLRAEVIRTHIWAERFIDGIILQTLENPKNILKNSFASKQKRLFDLGLIGETHNQELKILNDIRNQYAHELYPDEQALESIKKFPSYQDVEKYPEIMKISEPKTREMSKLGFIMMNLLKYLMDVFWNPKIQK